MALLGFCSCPWILSLPALGTYTTIIKAAAHTPRKPLGEYPSTIRAGDSYNQKLSKDDAGRPRGTNIDPQIPPFRSQAAK